MEKIFRSKKFMVAILSIVLLLMIGIATLCIVRSKTNKYSDNNNWELKIRTSYNEARTEAFYKIEVKRDGKKTLECKEWEIKFVKKLDTKYTPDYLKNNNIELSFRSNYIECWKPQYIKYEFVEYPFNTKKNILMIYIVKQPKD